MGVVLILGIFWLIVGIFLLLKKSHQGNLGCGWILLAALLGPFEFFLAEYFDSMFDDD